MTVGGDSYFGIPVIHSPYVPPGVVYLLPEPLFRPDTEPITIRDGSEDKHPVIQSWLNGTLSTEAALLLALTSGDPLLAFWGRQVLVSRMATPESIVKINIV